MIKNLKTFLIVFILSLPFWWGINVLQKDLESFLLAQISLPLQDYNSIIFEIKKFPIKPKPEISAQAVISLKIDKNEREQILLEYNIDQPLPIASLTKLMTALIVFENTPENHFDFFNVITVSQEAADQVNVPVFGNLEQGDKLLLERALELMLIYSSNDAAFALADIIGVDNFVKKMNLKAKSLGLENTNFINPTGLDEVYKENINDLPEINNFNYSSAWDLIKIIQYIIKEQPKIFEISTYRGPYPIENNISDLVIPEKFKVFGGKTGYTQKAEGCLALILEDEKENKFINIILGAVPRTARIEEMQKLIDWLL